MKRTAQAHAKLGDLIARNAGRADVLAALHYLNSQVFSAEKNSASEESELMQAMTLMS